MNDPLPPVDYLVEGLIPRYDRVLLYAEPGAGKTWLGLDLGLSIASDQAWLDTFRVPTNRRVLYIDEEMNPHTLERRIKRLAMGAGLRRDKHVPLVALSRPGILFSPEGVEQLIHGVKDQGFDPEVVVVDSLRRVLVGSENDAEAVGRFWRAIEPLTAGRTTIVIHHMKKPVFQAHGGAGNDVRYRASGSTDLIAGADTTFAVTRARGDAMIIECTKARHGEEASPFIVSLYDTEPEGPISLRFERWNTDMAAVAAIDHAAKVTIDYLSTLPERQARTVDIDGYLKAQGIAERTAQRARKELAKIGQLVPLKRGMWQLAGDCAPALAA